MSGAHDRPESRKFDLGRKSIPPDLRAVSDGRTTLATYWTQVGALDRSRAETAWAWFVRRYRRFVHGVLIRLVGAADAESATNEFWSFLFVSGALQRADRTRRLRSFLVGVLRNYARQRMRQRVNGTTRGEFAAEPAVEDLHEEEELALWANSVLHNALSAMESRWPSSVRIIRCFYGLPDPDGTPARAMSVSETATHLGCTVNAVHQGLHRGRQRLRHCVMVELRDLVGAQEVAEEIPLILEVIGRQSPGLTHG